MKIYHKRSFFLALVWFGYALWPSFRYPDAGIFNVFPAITSSFIALSNLYHALNKKKAKELIIQDSDEMLVLQRLKGYRAAFWTFCGLLMLIALIAPHCFDPSTGYIVALTISLSVLLMLLLQIIMVEFQSRPNQ